MTQFILIRHGETLWNEQNRYQGKSDLGLSRRGKETIKWLSRMIRKLDIDVLYTSPLKRARQSSTIISSKIGIKSISDPKLKEINFGHWEGKTAEQLISQKDKSFLSWSKGKWVTPVGGESIHSLRRRTRQFLWSCLKKHRDQNILIVSHSGPIRALILESLRLPRRFLFSFKIEPASLSSIAFYSRKSAVLSAMNIVFKSPSRNFLTKIRGSKK